ncbi:RWP-RK domain [Dillenia turbinata]|uniref:RWP-RK domain n=1 Tax=Dillenia turbinata TaxID=194707 RepID=A0AAN8VEP9_9MAGN
MALSPNNHNSSSEMGNLQDPSEDPVVWDLLLNPNMENPNQYSLSGQSRNNQADQPNTIRPPLVRSVPSNSFNCFFCHVLRQITHTKEKWVRKLEIHGRLGLFSHAVLETCDITRTDEESLNRNLQAFEFSEPSNEIVKQFLTQYCVQQKQAGFTMLKDPLSTFYDALRVGRTRPNDFAQLPPLGTPLPINPPGTSLVAEDKKPKIPLKEQRRRTKKLQAKDLRRYYSIPLDSAADVLNVCGSVMKKLCQKFNVTRWPHRKIKSFKRKITLLQPLLRGKDPEERKKALLEIQQLQQRITTICSGNGEG